VKIHTKNPGKARFSHASCRVGALMLIAVMLLGFGAAYLFAAGSRAAIAGTTSTPKPDPPPTTTSAPQPAPPAPPTRTYVAPPPPVVTARTHPVAPNHHHVRRHRPAPAAPTPQRARRTVVLTSSGGRPPGPGLLYATRITAESSGVPASLKLLLAAALGLLVLMFAAALAPARALPPTVYFYLDARRELVVGAASALTLGLAVGLAVAFLS
jgi:hypothetical protein